MSILLRPPTHRHSGQRDREQNCECVKRVCVRSRWGGRVRERPAVGLRGWRWGYRELVEVRLRGLEQEGQRAGKSQCSQGVASRSLRSLSTPSCTSLVLCPLLLACRKGDQMEMSCVCPQPSLLPPLPPLPKNSVPLSPLKP